MCDPGDESCRDILINYIRGENLGIDVAFWFMTDARYTNELIKRKNAGVPIRVLIDTRANGPYPVNADRIQELVDGGIPIRNASSSLFLHWKMMLFHGQNVVQFSGANYSPHAWRPGTDTPYENYTDEAIYFTDDSSIVNSFRTQYDDAWTHTSRFTDYANVSGPLQRHYDTFPKDPELNFPPAEGYRNRAVARYNEEGQSIDVIMFRATDGAHADAMIKAVARNVPVRLITEPDQYRDPVRMWHSYQIDRMYMGGVQIKNRKHLGTNHQKSVILHGKRMVIFGSSNWTESSNNQQYEHNMFTVRPHIYDWFVTQFERKWNNTGGVIENEPFVPLPPGAPTTPAPALGATGVSTSVTLSWIGGHWAHLYDVYFGTTPNPPRIAENLALGPSETSTQKQQYTVPVTLQEGTTYYWRVVGKTMALQEKSSEEWSFTTSGTATGPEPLPPSGQLGPGDILMYASKASVTGNYTVIGDASAAGGQALWNPNANASKLSAPLASPPTYFEMQFQANAGTAYRIWIRGRAEGNGWANDSLFAQFSGSVNSSGSPVWRIGTTSGMDWNLEDCSGCGLSGWGWQDNGWGVGVLGPLVYFAQTGTQTIRIQPREDGLIIDQIMFSPQAYLTTAPGALKNDTTIYPESDATSPPPPAVTVVRQPYLQQVSSTSAIVAWTTREPGPAEVKVHSGSSTRTIAATSTLFTATSTGTVADYYQHEARITGLTAATTYTYDILVNGIDANSGTDTFKTAPGNTTTTVRFIGFGDSGTGSTAQHQVNAVIKTDTFDFAVHSGDVTYGSSSGTGTTTHQNLEDWFFSVYKDWLRSKPMFPSMGNHDSNSNNGHGRPYKDGFILPEHGGEGGFTDHAERYYSYAYGPVHVVVLDTELAFQDTTRRAAQLAWLEADLETTARPWKVAVFHRSPYSSGGGHGSDLAVRAAFGPIFEQYGVQLVISGHEHIYERTKPINGVTYIVSGGGGAPLYSAGTSDFTAFSASRHHYVRGTAAECTLKMEAIGTNGSIFDTITLDRCSTPPPPDTEAPTISITSPSDGATVSGNVTVSVSTSDNVGVVAVELYVDGNKVLEDTTSPFGFTWNSTSVSNATHTLEARARDAAGNVGSSGAILVQVNNSSSGTGDIVLYAADATVVQGGWQKEADSTAAGGAKLRHPNAGAAKLSTALANPTHYFELTFDAQAGIPYHIWIRGRADNDHWANDSVFVQFSNETTYGIGTTSSVEVNLEDCSGCKLSGWGWQDNGWGVGVMGPHITFSNGGTKTIRVQTREDGFAIDQIVLSPGTYLNSSPGALKNDTTILPPSGGEPPPPDTTKPTAQITSPANGATVSGTVTVAVDASDNVGVARVDLLVDGVLTGTDSSAPYTFAWSTGGASQGTHTLQAIAVDAAGNTGSSAIISVTVDNSTTSPSQEVVIYASDAVKVAGNWQLVQDSSAANGWAIHNPNQGAAKLKNALASPSDYIEFTFQAEANVPYHLWIRARAQNNGWGNDSVFIQFTDNTSYPIGTSSAAEMNLEDCSGCGLSGWGWQDNGWGVGVMGPDIYFTSSGTKTIRIQPREDGIFIDQIVLSAQKYLTTSPGALKNDTTIVPKQ